MGTSGILPSWAPRVKQSLIRRLYENDARGMLDETLLSEVGWGLHARCASFISAVEAVHGRAPCPVCGAVILHQHGPKEILHCPGCGWENSWAAYFSTIQHKQLSGAEKVLELFADYIERFPRAKDAREKMLLIDGLLHGFHWYAKFGNTRAVCVNLIEGRLHEVVAFLDALSYGPASTPGLQQRREDWHAEIDRITGLWGRKTG